jgi:2'-5' RNA ligase
MEQSLRDFKRYGFAIVPDPGTAERLIVFQKIVSAKYPLLPELGLAVNRPHITIYQGSFRGLTPVEETLEELRKILCGWPLLTLSFTGIIYKHSGWYFLTVRVEQWMRNLQSLLLERVGEFIVSDGQRAPEANGYTADELTSLRSFGYPYVGRAFLPHITIGRDTSSYSEIELSYLNSVWAELGPREGRIQGVTFYRMGVNGAHLETVHEALVGAADPD